MKRFFIIIFLVTLGILLPATFVEAHGRSTSYITWTIHGTLATARVKMALLDQNALQSAWSQTQPPRNPESALPEVVFLSGDAGVCRFVPLSFHELSAEHGAVVFEWQAHCALEDGTPFSATKLHSDLLFDVIAAHSALVRFQDIDDGREVESVLTESRREIVLPARTPARFEHFGSTVVRFGRAGIEHLLTGWDHLAFLLALVLASRSFRTAILCLTGFTLGHSLTLSLAVLGHASVKTSTVEVMIALSIALVSLENVWIAEGRAGLRLPVASVAGLLFLTLLGFSLGTISPLAFVGLAIFEACHLGLLAKSTAPERLRWLSASLFGLLHGFGFAGSLNQIALPSNHRAVPLASFNVGLEIAQIGVVCLAWPLLLQLRKRYIEKNVLVWGSAMTLAIGTYACVTRLWG